MIPDWLSDDVIHLLFRGLALTVWITAISTCLSLILGIGVGLMRLSGSRIMRFVALLYVEIHRNVPALVLMIFWAFAFPNLIPEVSRRELFFDNPFVASLERLTGLSVPYYTIAAILALTLNTSAYLAELFRAGVGSLPVEYIDAARTLGASQQAILRYIIIPQGILAAFPAVTTRLIHHMKNTTLAALVSTPEFFHSLQTSISRSFHATELLLFGAVVFLALSSLYSTLLRWIEKSWKSPPLVKPNDLEGVQMTANLVGE